MRRQSGKPTPRILRELEACGYRVAFGEPGQFTVSPGATGEAIRFIERCKEQIIDELCERIVDGSEAEVFAGSRQAK